MIDNSISLSRWQMGKSKSINMPYKFMFSGILWMPIPKVTRKVCFSNSCEPIFSVKILKIMCPPLDILKKNIEYLRHEVVSKHEGQSISQIFSYSGLPLTKRQIWLRLELWWKVLNNLLLNSLNLSPNKVHICRKVSQLDFVSRLYFRHPRWKSRSFAINVVSNVA